MNYPELEALLARAELGGLGERSRILRSLEESYLPELLAKARAYDELLATNAYEVVERGCHENFDGAIYGLPNESIGKTFRLLAVEEPGNG